MDSHSSKPGPSRSGASADHPSQSAAEVAGPMNRRAFLGSAGLAVGGAAVAALLPLSLRAAPRAAAVPARPADEVAGGAAGRGTDEVYGVSLYSYPIPYGWQYSSPLAAQVAPVDRIFMG